MRACFKCIVRSLLCCSSSTCRSEWHASCSSYVRCTEGINVSQHCVGRTATVIFTLHDMHTIVHPAGNILVTHKCELRISDFGLARERPKDIDSSPETGHEEGMTEVNTSYVIIKLSEKFVQAICIVSVYRCLFQLALRRDIKGKYTAEVGIFKRVVFYCVGRWSTRTLPAAVQ